MVSKRELHIALKALELKNQGQNNRIERLERDYKETSKKIESEEEEWDNMLTDFFDSSDLKELGLLEESQIVDLNHEQIILNEVNDFNWKEVLKESRTILKKNNINPDEFSLPPTKHDLLKKDIFFSILISVFSIVLPSLGKGHKNITQKFYQIENKADKEKFNSIIQNVFGSKDAAHYLDIKKGGRYHRYIFGHDLAEALPLAINKQGIKGVIKTFQHILKDSFGTTGVPFPGTSKFLKFISNKNTINEFNDFIKASESISHKEISKYTGIRATDSVVSVSVGILLFLYNKINNIPVHSMRRPKMAIITHGLCTTGIALVSLFLSKFPLLKKKILPHRSKINYISFMAMLKNSWKLNSMVNKLHEENQTRLEEVENNLEKLQFDYNKTNYNLLENELIKEGYYYG